MPARIAPTRLVFGRLSTTTISRSLQVWARSESTVSRSRGSSPTVQTTTVTRPMGSGVSRAHVAGAPRSSGARPSRSRCSATSAANAARAAAWPPSAARSAPPVRSTPRGCPCSSTSVSADAVEAGSGGPVSSSSTHSTGAWSSIWSAVATAAWWHSTSCRAPPRQRWRRTVRRARAVLTVLGCVLATAAWAPSGLAIGGSALNGRASPRTHGPEVERSRRRD